MKKLMCLLLALLLFTLPALAEPDAEESAPLTYEELEIYLTGLAAQARKEAATCVPGEGFASVQASFGTLYIADESLDENTAILGVSLAGEQEDPRGLELGDTLDSLLAAYPNDNDGLYGTYYDAALYVAGEKPEVTVGWVLRDGQRVTEVVHCVYSWRPDGVIASRVAYRLENDTILAISVDGMHSLIEEAQALQEIAEVADMQEHREYFAYPKAASGAALSPFEREDLSFARMDLLDLTPEGAVAVLGPSLVDERSRDTTGEELRLKQWEGISILFVYAADGTFQRVDTLTINEDLPDGLEGPRGVRIGDTLDSVMHRFLHEGTSAVNGGLALYGDGVTAPYGTLAYGDKTASLTYVLAVNENQNVLWHMTFVDGVLQESIMLLR